MLGQIIDGRYRIDARLARGGMATVYQATDMRLDRPVAVKILHPHLAEGPRFVDRFRREARAAARLIDPGIVSVHDQGTWGEAPYLVMELVDGPNLRTLMLSSGLPSVGKALDFTIQVLQALAVAHTAGFVHRDIKPENILITRSGQVKVADFGLARAVSEVTAASSGVVLGTVAYLSPELIAEGVADKRADVYAVGVVLFELLTGTQPFVADAPIQVAFQHVHAEFPPPSSRVGWLPQEIDSLVLAFTAKDPAHRPEDATAGLALIRAVRAGLPPEIAERVPEAAVVPPLEEGEFEQLPDAVAAPPAPDNAGAAPGPVDDSTDPVPTAPPGSGTGGTQALPLAKIPPTIPPVIPPAARGVPGRRRRHRALWFVLAALLVLGGGAGGTLYWYFEHGPGSLVAVPRLEGLPQADADAALKARDLAAKVATDFSDEVAEGVVISASREEGARVKPGTIVDLVVSKGVREATVPETGIVGQSAADAQAELSAAGLDGKVTEDGVYHTTIPEGVVIEVTPNGGATVPHHEPITLTVSKGPEPVVVPDLRGKTLDQALEAVAELELTVEPGDPEYSEEVAEGLIISQEPGAQGDSFRGRTVTVIVSRGMPPVEVPKVTGLTYEAAVAALEQRGLLAVKRVPIGQFLNIVQAQDPEPGKTVPKGSTVTLTVV
jgi:serine/threonine-protein kinase